MSPAGNNALVISSSLTPEPQQLVLMKISKYFDKIQTSEECSSHNGILFHTEVCLTSSNIQSYSNLTSP